MNKIELLAPAGNLEKAILSFIDNYFTKITEDKKALYKIEDNKIVLKTDFIYEWVDGDYQNINQYGIYVCVLCNGRYMFLNNDFEVVDIINRTDALDYLDWYENNGGKTISDAIDYALAGSDTTVVYHYNEQISDLLLDLLNG